MAKMEAVAVAPAERPGPSSVATDAPTPLARRGPGGVARFVRSSPLGTVALLFLLFVVLMAILADVITYWDPFVTNYGLTRAAPSADHLLGTDHLGRDVWSRIVTGARISLFVALIAVLVGDGVGLVWGVVSGYFGGRLDLVSQRVLDALLSFPGLILAMLLLVGLGAGLSTVIIAIAVTRIPLSTRVIRSVALSTKSLAYVEAARALGASPGRILIRHVAPQCIAPFLVIVSANIGVAITTEAGLSFLGIGIPPPTPTWGNMLGGVLAESFRPPWWLVVYPGVALTSTVLAANLFGDALRDFLDPRLRGRLTDL
jgi:ABC-type dipeptide/oligopeptide/nickel transport system permease subunit